MSLAAPLELTSSWEPGTEPESCSVAQAGTAATCSAPQETAWGASLAWKAQVSWTMAQRQMSSRPSSCPLPKGNCRGPEACSEERTPGCGGLFP